MKMIGNWRRISEIEKKIGNEKLEDKLNVLLENGIIDIRLRTITGMHYGYYEFIRIKDYRKFNEYINNGVIRYD